MTAPHPQTGLHDGLHDGLRIGLYGGAFDPPHLAHIALARAAVQELGLHRLHITPTGGAWHKSRPLSAARHRLAMCRLSFADLPQAVIDPRELRRRGPSYTIDTLLALQAAYPASARLHLIIGADQAAAFHTWKDAVRITQLATVCIARRASQDEAPPESTLSTLPGLPQVAPHLLDTPALAHSSTRVRQMAAAGQPLLAHVTPEVARYIARHHLYESSSPP